MGEWLLRRTEVGVGASEEPCLGLRIGVDRLEFVAAAGVVVRCGIAFVLYTK